MNRRISIAAIGFLTFMALMLHGKARGASPKPVEALHSSRYGGELAIGLGNKPLHLNSAISSGTYTGFPAAQIFAFLLRMDHDWEYRPYLAQSWEVSPDNLSVTFHLHPNATFHDGRPVTSADVAFSLLTIREYHPFSDMLSALDRVDTPDPLTAVIRLKRPHPALLTVLGSPMAPILPKHVFGDGRDIRTHPANRKPVGAGPFKFVSFTDSEIILERYPDFFLPDRPYLDRLIIKIMPVPAIRVALEAGTVDLYGFSVDLYGFKGEQDKLLENIGENRIELSGYEAVGILDWLAFNLRKPPLDDIRVRRAFAHAIDRDFLAKAYFSSSKVATGPISPDSPFYSADVNRYPVDTDLANRLLDAAGYPRNEKGVRFTLTIAPQTGMNLKIPEYVQYVLSRKLGVETRILHFDNFSDWARHVAGGDFELAVDAVFNWGDPVIGVHRSYSSRNIRPGVIWSNTQGYSNPVADRLMEAAAVETDPARRREIYARFQKQVAADLPVLWLLQISCGTVYHRKLSGIRHASVWGTLFPFTDVYWQSE